jgi:hypothetical protein
MTDRKMHPRCVWDPIQKEQKGMAFSASGYLLPCCWCDNVNLFEDFGSITQEKFHISNVETVEEVLESKEWNDLMQTIQNNYENAPSICKSKCSQPWLQKKIDVSNI